MVHGRYLAIPIEEEYMQIKKFPEFFYDEKALSLESHTDRQHRQKQQRIFLYGGL